MQEKLVQIKNFIEENVKTPLEEEALELLTIAIYALYLSRETVVDFYLPDVLSETNFITGKEDIKTLFEKKFSIKESTEEKKSAAFYREYLYEEETEVMYVKNYLLLSTTIKNPVDAIARTCAELLHLCRSRNASVVNEKVRAKNGINIDVVNSDRMEINRKHLIFECATVQYFADEAIETLGKEIAILSKKELQAISPLLARFKKELPNYAYDIFPYEKNVIHSLCTCPSLKQALDFSFYEETDVSTFAETFNTIFGSSSAFLKFTRCLDEVAKKGEVGTEQTRFMIETILTRVNDRAFEEVIGLKKETLK